MGNFLFGSRLFHLAFIAIFWVGFTPAKAENKSEITYVESLERLESSVFYNDLVEAFEVIKAYPTVEAYAVIHARIEKFLDQDIRVVRQDFPDVVNLLLESMLYVGSKADIPLILEIHKWAYHHALDESIQEKTTEVIEALDKIPSAQLLKSLDSTIQHMQNSARAIDHKIALAEVGKLLDTMKLEVKGQDEILNALADLYMNDLLFSGQRLTPEIFYMMGLPGNGKDTIAEAYVKAIWDGSSSATTDHLFRVNIQSVMESWSYFGSPKGYMGSTEMPDFLRFLVEHSGGKYLLVQTQDGKTVIEHNPKWKGKNLPGYHPPSKAVIFINEVHNVPMAVKDNVLKQAIERGIFKITNPGNTPNSASVIELPMFFMFASNEGIDLLEPREKNGARLGAPLSYERLIENFDRVSGDKDLLKQAVLKNNGEINNPAVGSDAKGTSEEFLSRIPNNRIFIMRPLSPETLEAIARITIQKYSKNLYAASGRLGNYQIEVSDELIKFITDYNYIPSENARPINGRVRSFIFNQISQALRTEKIKPLGTLQHINITLKEYPNGVRSVVFYVVEPETGHHYQFSRIIPETLKDRVNRPLSYERVQEIALMREQMIQNVFGVEHIVDALIESVIVSESESLNKDSERKATVMAFLGMTSTGKTETAKQYVKARYGEKERPVIIDFNTIKSVEALEAKILGSVDSRKNPIASDFMKAYDRANGNIAFIFDEAANAPKELLKALYEILREKVATGFSDGKPRPMKNVTIILTGNAGEQIYRGIPTDLPSELYERALHEMFKIFIKNEDLQRKILAETFPDALLARLGKNIYHFGPLNHAGKRQIAQLKMLEGLKSLKAKPSERGWNILFKDEANLLQIFSMIEREAFDHHSQGASIDKFVSEAIIGKIKARLLLENVTSGSDVILEINEKTLTKTEGNQSHNYKVLVMTLESGRQIEIEIPIGVKKVSIKNSDVDKVLTAYHEAGHEIVSEVFFGDRVRPKYLSIIEGVTIIGDDIVHYAGLREGEIFERTQLTKEVILRHAAVWAAGYIAQGLVTTGGRHDAGKNDDMKRSTHLIQDAILRYGLSKEWGTRGIPSSMTTEDYISKTLSSNEKEKLNQLTNKWLKEAAQLAREALLANSEKLFANMSKAIASNGFIDGEAVYELYKANGLVTERDGQSYRDKAVQIREIVDQINEALEKHGPAFDEVYNDLNYSLENANKAYDFLMKKNMGLRGYITRSPWSKLSSFQQMVAGMYLSSRISYDSRDAKLSSSDWMPDKVANITDIIASQRLRQTEPVTDMTKFEVVGQAPAVVTDGVTETEVVTSEEPIEIAIPSISGSGGSCETYLAM